MIADLSSATAKIMRVVRFLLTLLCCPLAVQCRRSSSTYKAKLSVTVHWELDGRPGGGVTRVIGQVPIMVKVSCCHVNGCADVNLEWVL